ncbi:MAG: EamA family transporter [Pseudomonadota bacterium]|nr:EamA family transporter [Pseudomonadota bacterium]
MTETPVQSGKTPLWVIYAPGLFVLFWASGFPATRFGLNYIEPFTLLAARSGLNVLVVMAILPFVRVRWPRDWREVGHIAVAGFLLQFAYLGAMFVALGEGVSQGLAALVAGMQPLITAMLVGRWLGERVTAIQWAGFLLGFGGLAAVMWERINIGTGTPLGFAVIALTPFLITAGSLYQKRFCAHMDLRAGMIIQHSVAATACFGAALLLETREVIWGWELSFTLVWLVVILSFVATNLYYFMLRRGEAARVSGLFYLTPPTAVVLGYLTYGETFGVIAILGFGVAAAGVALISRAGGNA